MLVPKMASALTKVTLRKFLERAKLNFSVAAFFPFPLLSQQLPSHLHVQLPSLDFSNKQHLTLTTLSHLDIPNLISRLKSTHSSHLQSCLTAAEDTAAAAMAAMAVEAILTGKIHLLQICSDKSTSSSAMLKLSLRQQAIERLRHNNKCQLCRRYSSFV